ncbi:MAG: DUF933 domain-containing protein [Candidatus Cloacimonadaceae bacterium]
MKLALIGPPKSGKTTVFNALTGSEQHTDKYSSASEANIGIVQVLDERITRLSEIYKPKKTIYANLEVQDFPGIFAREGENPESVIMSQIKNSDAFVLVLRSFADSELDGLYGDDEPLKMLAHFIDEMVLADLIIAEKRIEKIELGYKRGVKTPAIQIEEKALRNIIQALQEGISIRELQLSMEEEKATRGFQFFSAKPLLVLLNASEDELNEKEALLAEIRKQGFMAEVIAGKLEADISQLETEEALLFLADMGLVASFKDRLIALSYSLLGLQSFFTVGADEVRAWAIEKGTNAVSAAGKIHSDLARGFIRAECFNYDELLTHGSEKALREKGLFRLEGKEYPVKDGDILNIRFNV